VSTVSSGIRATRSAPGSSFDDGIAGGADSGRDILATGAPSIIGNRIGLTVVDGGPRPALGGRRMIGFIIRTVVIAIAVAVVAYVYPSITYGDDLTTLAVVAVILGLLNAFVKPLIGIFALPLNMMTLGLFGVVINAALLLVVAFIADLVGFDFVVGGFPPEFGIDAIVAAFVGAIGISIVGTIVGMVVPD
jgi:putative membrane protein